MNLTVLELRKKPGLHLVNLARSLFSCLNKLICVSGGPSSLITGPPVCDPMLTGDGQFGGTNNSAMPGQEHQDPVMQQQ